MSKAFLVDYEWCTGCHSCEVACQMVNDFPPGQFGVKLSIFGPWPYGEGEWVFTNAPFFTEQCNCCAGLETATGQPYCVAHCQAKCLVFGELDELQKLMAAKPSQLLQGVGKR